MIKGSAARRTRENDHPLVKAMQIPDTDIAKDIISVPIFSPNAFYMAKVSFPILADISAGLLKSYHSGSCLRMAAM